MNPRRIGNLMPLSPKLDDSEFAQVHSEIMQYVEQQRTIHGDTPWLQLVDRFGNVSGDLMSRAFLLLDIPRTTHHHEPATHHNYRNTIDSHNHNDEFTQTKYEQHVQQQLNQEIVIVSDKCHLFRLTSDLTINVAQIIAYRRSTCELIIPGATLNLTELEAARLEMLLRSDFNV